MYVRCVRFQFAAVSYEPTVQVCCEEQALFIPGLRHSLSWAFFHPVLK